MRRVYYNGKVVTLEGDDCTAFIVEDGQFAKVGNEELLVDINYDEKIDLKERRFFPLFLKHTCTYYH